MKTPSIFNNLTNRSFAFKLTALFLAVTFGIFIIATIVLGLKWYDLLSKGLVARGQLLTQNARTQLNCVVDNAENISRIYYAQLNTDREQYSDEDLLAVRRVIERHTPPRFSGQPFMGGVAIVLDKATLPFDDSHYFIYNQSSQDKSVLRQLGDDVYSSAQWYSQAKRISTPFWTPPVKLTPDSPTSCLYVTPLYHDQTSMFLGALVVEIPLSALQQQIDNIQIEGEGACFLYFSDGTPMARSKNAASIDPQYDRKFRPPVEQADYDGNRMPLPDKPSHVYLDNNNGDDPGSNVFYARCDNGWSVSFVMAGDWVQTRLGVLFRYISIIFIVTMPIVMLVSFLLTRRITDPLTRLTEAAEAIGGGQFNVTLPKYRGNDEVALLTRSFEQMQQELAIYIQELKKSFQQQEHIESELNIAKTIQTGILPKVEAPFDTAEQFEMEALLIPAKGVGGDLYDFFFLDETHLALIVGDVSGKGIPAALFMSVTQTLQRSISFRFKQPGDIVNQLNKLLLRNNEASMFVTYFIGVIDVTTGRMTYCNAGHNYPIIRRGNGNLEVLDQRNGLPLGILEETYTYNEVALSEQDTLVLYTDGITEAFNPHNELFGDIRLKEAVSYAMSSCPHKIINTILSHLEIFVEGHEQSDDITLLALCMKTLNNRSYDELA